LSLCNRNLTPLQRRSVQLMGVAILLTVLTNFSTPNLTNPLLDLFPGLSRIAAHDGHPSAVVVWSIAAFSVIPVLFAVWVAGRYLKAEPDEFIRVLVVRALLWGFAVTMAGNAIAGVYINFYSGPFPLSVLNADLFFVSTGIAFRLLHRSYR
jgi:hypothetical protein